MGLVTNIASAVLLGISAILELAALIQDSANETMFSICSVLEIVAFSVSRCSHLKLEAIVKCGIVEAELFIKQIHSVRLHYLNMLCLLNAFDAHFVPRALTVVGCLSMPELVPLYFVDKAIQKFVGYLDMKQRQSTFVFSTVIQGFVAISAACCRLT